MRTTTANSTYPKVAVQWLSQALCFYQSLCLVDPARAGLLNRHPRVAAKRRVNFKDRQKNDNDRQLFR